MIVLFRNTIQPRDQQISFLTSDEQARSLLFFTEPFTSSSELFTFHNEQQPFQKNGSAGWYMAVGVAL